MAYRIFVGGLPSWCSENDLWHWCEGSTGHQAVHSHVVASGKGATMSVGFLGFPTHQAMQTVLHALQGARFYGHRISVKVSKDSQPQPVPASSSSSRTVEIQTDLSLLRGGPEVGLQTEPPPSGLPMAVQTEPPPKVLEVEVQTEPPPKVLEVEVQTQPSPSGLCLPAEPPSPDTEPPSPNNGSSTNRASLQPHSIPKGTGRTYHAGR